MVSYQMRGCCRGRQPRVEWVDKRGWEDEDVARHRRRRGGGEILYADSAFHPNDLNLVSLHENEWKTWGTSSLVQQSSRSWGSSARPRGWAELRRDTKFLLFVGSPKREKVSMQYTEAITAYLPTSSPLCIRSFVYLDHHFILAI